MSGDYLEYRGKCKEMSEALILKDPSLTLVRGTYWDYMWGDQPHWWCTREDGTIVDPTAKQFPSKGQGDYTPFDGVIICSQCGKETNEDEASFESNYAFCSGLCHGKFVGVF